jgi:hypothetical protein
MWAGPLRGGIGKGPLSVEFELSRDSGAAAHDRAGARLDRLTIGPQAEQPDPPQRETNPGSRSTDQQGRNQNRRDEIAATKEKNVGSKADAAD